MIPIPAPLLLFALVVGWPLIALARLAWRLMWGVVRWYIATLRIGWRDCSRMWAMAMAQREMWRGKRK